MPYWHGVINSTKSTSVRVGYIADVLIEGRNILNSIFYVVKVSS